MSVINIVAWVLFASVVQADVWDYSVTQIEQNDTYIMLGYDQEKVMAVLDYSNEFISFFDGKNGTLYLINYETSVVIYFSDGFWNATLENFDPYIRNNPLKKIYDERRAEGYKCQPTTVPPGFFKPLKEILGYLIEGFSSECESFSTAIWVGTVHSAVMRTMSGFEDVFGEISGQISLDIEYLVGFYQGMEIIFRYFDNGIQTLAEANIKIDVLQIIDAASRSGFHVLVQVVGGLSSYLETLDGLLDYLNDQYNFFVLVRQLGGKKIADGDQHQLSNFIYTIVDVMSVIKGELSFKNLHTTLTKYHKSGSRGKDVEKEWEDALKTLQDSIKKNKLEKKLEDLVKLLKDIRDKKWKFGNFNMSLICEILFLIIKVEIDPVDLEDIWEEFLDALESGPDSDDKLQSIKNEIGGKGSGEKDKGSGEKDKGSGEKDKGSGEKKDSGEKKHSHEDP